MGKLTEEQKHELQTALSLEQYGLIARRIKRENGGAYPDDWYAVVIAPGGIHSQLEARFQAPGAFKVRVSAQ